MTSLRSLYLTGPLPTRLECAVIMKDKTADGESLDHACPDGNARRYGE